MRLVPSVVPQPREMTDLGGVGGSDLHRWHPVMSVLAVRTYVEADAGKRAVEIR